MNLTGWMPARISWQNSSPRVEWTLMGNQRLLEPSFAQTMQRQMMHPFHQLFRRETSIEEMADFTGTHPGAPLRGIIFHVSRCGSTLAARQLAALDRNIVAIEPEPLDDLLQPPQVSPGLPRAQHLRWLRALVAALAQPRNGEEAFYLKTHCWHIHSFHLLREAFPDTPWLFLYRDPVKVLLSHTRNPAAWMVPALLHPSVLLLEPADWNPASLETYRARALANLYSAGLHAAQNSPSGLLINHSELPQAIYSRLLPHFSLHPEDFPAMQQPAETNSTSQPSAPPPNPTPRQTEAINRVQAATKEHIESIYHQLETTRLAGTENQA